MLDEKELSELQKVLQKASMEQCIALAKRFQVQAEYLANKSEQRLLNIWNLDS